MIIFDQIMRSFLVVAILFSFWGYCCMGYSSCVQELPPTIIETHLPSDFPVGTYYRNGPGRLHADDGISVAHPFDGDGMIVAMTFDPKNNRMLFRNKFIETKAYIKDKKSGTMSTRGVFGTMKRGGFLRNAFDMGYKNTANANVLYAGDSLYALCEAGKPYALDPLTLKNKIAPGIKGECDIDGLIKDTFSAHPRYDPKKEAYVNFGLTMNPIKGKTTVHLYELDKNFNKSRESNSVPSFKFNGYTLLHDFILTDNYCIFNIYNCKMSFKIVLKALMGRCGLSKAMKIDKSANHTNIVCVPRSLFQETEGVTNMDPWNDDRISVVQVPMHCNMHYGNAFEDDDGNVVFDTVQSTGDDIEAVVENMEGKVMTFEPGDPLIETGKNNVLVRYTINIKDKSYTQREINPDIADFPTIPKAMSTNDYTYLYCTSSSSDYGNLSGKLKLEDFDIGVQKVNVNKPDLNERCIFEHNAVPGEVVFVPKVGRDVTKSNQEDAGYLLVEIHNVKEKSTDLAIFDAEGEGSITKGPILRQRLPVYYPFMLHGTFAEGVTFSFDKFT